jgi:hypothetical protein
MRESKNVWAILVYLRNDVGSIRKEQIQNNMNLPS